MMARGFGTDDDRGSGDGGFSNSFANTLRLPLQQVLPCSRTPSPEEIADESRMLFLNFAEEQILRQNDENLENTFQEYKNIDTVIEDSAAEDAGEIELEDDDNVVADGHGGGGVNDGNPGIAIESNSQGMGMEYMMGRSSAFSHCGHAIGPEIGRKLQKLADNFAHTRERVELKEQADTVDLGSVTRDQFVGMLGQLFHDGNNIPERIVVLFFFCSDIVIKTIKKHKINLFSKFLRWSLSYLSDLVTKLGGWERIFTVVGNFVLGAFGVVCMCAITVAAIIYIRKNV